MPHLSKTPKTSSPDYPSLAKKLLEASGDDARSKLPMGLYVVATPIGHLGDVTLRALMTLANVERIACEDTRVSGGMLSKYGIKKPLIAYHDHNADHAGGSILRAIQDGQAVALISDAGMPLISDPGFGLVNACLKAGYPVTVIPGANAALTALAGSGLPTDRFHFCGFLPPKSVARRKALTSMLEIPGTLIFYEAPQRLAETLADMASVFGDDRAAAVARELTKLFEEQRRGTLGELAEHYATHDVKGEIVILVAPRTDSAEASTADIDALLAEALRTQTLRDAVAAVSDLTGVKKNEVYARALKLAEKDN